MDLQKARPTMANLFAFCDKKDKTIRFVVTGVTVNIIYLSLERSHNTPASVRTVHSELMDS